MATNNAILYGIGQGSAQIINNGEINNGFAQLLAKQQAQRQQEVKALADQQAQLKPEGLRNDADRKDFFNQVDDWRNKAVSAQNERDPYKKALLKSQADNAYLQAQDLVSKSKQRAQIENQLSNHLLDDTFRHQYKDDAVNTFLNGKQLSVNDPNLPNPDMMARQVDHRKIMDLLDKADQAALKQTQYSTPIITNQKVGNRVMPFIQQNRTLDPADRAQMYSQMYDTQPDIKKFFNDVYPQAFQAGLSPKAQRDAAIQQYIKDSGDVSEFHAPVPKPEPVDNFYSHYAYELAHPRAGAANSQLTPAQMIIAGNPTNGQPGMLQGDQTAMNRFISLHPKGQYGGKEPEATVDPLTNEHVFKFPAQVVPDEKAIKDNQKLRASYNNNPEKQGCILGFGGTPIPIEKSKKAALLQPEVKVKRPAQEYRLNPADGQTYISQAAQMAADQNIKLPQLNQILGQKSGHGMINPTTTKIPPTKKDPLGLGI